MPKAFTVAFARYTPESIEDGDAESCGMLTDSPVCLRAALEYARDEPTSRQALHSIEANDSRDSDARWISFMFSEDYETGESIETSIHWPENTTPSTRARLCRLLRNA
jgi:hypothetical protein